MKIMDDENMNRVAQRFIKKYLYECARRNNRLKQQTKEFETLKKQKSEPAKNQIIFIR